jgi:anti-anti-sigma factor
MASYSFRTIRVADTATVFIAGDIDLLTATEFKDAGDKVLRDERVATVVIDCAEVTSIDAAAVSVLLGWRRYALEVAKPLRFRHVPTVMADALGEGGAQGNASALGTTGSDSERCESAGFQQESAGFQQ